MKRSTLFRFFLLVVMSWTISCGGNDNAATLNSDGEVEATTSIVATINFKSAPDRIILSKNGDVVTVVRKTPSFDGGTIFESTPETFSYKKLTTSRNGLIAKLDRLEKQFEEDEVTFIIPVIPGNRYLQSMTDLDDEIREIKLILEVLDSRILERSFSSSLSCKSVPNEGGWSGYQKYPNFELKHF